MISLSEETERRISIMAKSPDGDQRLVAEYVALIGRRPRR